uniref:Clp R domain-containing protein n=1 Tax=Oryza punctata TaxID=4537 RepID=A0A0E0MIN0_ORYPU
MAAIKRSQANQRRNPDTFHFYHQAATAQTPAAVKVELSQLVLAILDDPVVSRVFAEAGFRSGDIKLAILRPSPPMPLLGRLPTRSRPPPLFLCSFAAADDANVPSPAGNLAGAGEENCRRIAEILSRGRNPMLVGVGAASAADDFAAASPYRIIHVDPNTIDRSDLGVAAAMASATSGLIISIGDLKQLVPDDAEVQEKGRRVVAEVTRVLETHSKIGRVWVMGWSATYETYLAFLSKFPLVDKDWDLQLLPITAVHATAAAGPAAATGLMPPATTVAAFSKPAASLMDSFVPFGGFLCDNYEESSLTANSCPQDLRCQQCNDKYEQEVATIISASGITAEDHHQGGLPSLLQNGSMMGPSNGFDPVKVRDDRMVLNSKILNLRKKWNEYCLRLHQDHQRINRDPYKPFPRYIGVPTDKERSATPSKGSEAVGIQKDVIKPCAVSAVHTSSTVRPISSPSVTNKRNEDLVLNLQARHSKSDENLQERGMQSQHGTLSNLDNPDDHASPSSAAPVETDLVLGTPRECSSKGSSSAFSKRVEDSERSVHLVPKKVDDLHLKHPQLSVRPNSCSWSSKNVGKTSPSALHSVASGGLSAFGQWHKPSPLAAQNSDLSNYKLLVERLFKVVGRQEEALSAICESIVRCQSAESRRGPNRNDIWLCFHGSDSMAKKRIAVALAELMHGSKENLIHLDLNLQDWDDPSFRGKTGTDCIVEQLSKKRRSVLFLDNIDRADCLVQDSLSDAIKSGRFQDMRGKVVDINDSIVVLSRSMIQGSQNGLEEGLSFCEEKILAARGHRLKILVEPGRAITSGCPNGKVVVSPRHSLTKIQASMYSGSISKRKLSISDDPEKLQESLISSKRLHRTSSVPFDLNLPVDEDEPLDADDDSSSHENSYGNTEKSIDALLHSVDGSINFKPFDFDKLADDMLQEFSNILRKNLGAECMLEIDVGAMEQVLAAAWKSEDKGPVQSWLEQVFARSLDELKLKCKHVSSSTLRLVACEDTVPTVKGDGLGVLLPPRIILDC